MFGFMLGVQCINAINSAKYDIMAYDFNAWQYQTYNDITIRIRDSLGKLVSSVEGINYLISKDSNTVRQSSYCRIRDNTRKAHKILEEILSSMETQYKDACAIREASKTQ